MIVMPANSSGWFWHSLALMTGRLGHLYSPGAQRGPWPWLPYALDNGAFACWEPKRNTFDEKKWESVEAAWLQMLFWAQSVPQRPLWVIVPDRPGDWNATRERWAKYSPKVQACGFPLALAVQDGATPEAVKQISPAPDVIAIGGSTEWKWNTLEVWAKSFPRVHLLRCNAPDKLQHLHQLGIESCDGTGWNRGDRTQTRGLEEWLFQHRRLIQQHHALWPHVSRGACKKQITFA
jgi:hypothetical protein